MKKKKVLVIEDDQHINLLISDNLESAGYEVSSVFNGEEGVQRALYDIPDLIILDFLLPRMDGRYVCRRLRDAGSPARGIPIIIVSIMNKDMGLTDKGMGSITVMNKPFEVTVLLVEVKKC